MSAGEQVPVPAMDTATTTHAGKVLIGLPTKLSCLTTKKIGCKNNPLARSQKAFVGPQACSYTSMHNDT